MLTRRMLLGGALALPAAANARNDRGDLHVTLLGQSLIQQDVCALPWPGRDAILQRLAHADVVFTDLETAIAGATDASPTRVGEVSHAAPAEVIDCLRSLGVSLVATSNNHAWDLGTAGILSALAALDARKLAHAGSGRDLSAAASPGFVIAPQGSVALVAAAAGAIREGAAATPTRAGVNELRRDASGAPQGEDVARSLDAIRAARRGGAAVIAYLHNHYWEPDPADTPEWQRRYARQCVDAGAAMFVSHGPPLLQGIERYNGVPMLHGLGSFIFQTRKVEGSYGSRTWESLMVEAVFRDGAFVRASAVPLRLDSSKAIEAEFTRGVPHLADLSDASEICNTVSLLSARFGTVPRTIDGKLML